MLVYYQDFGASNPYRIQNFPASLAVRAGASSASPPSRPTRFEPPQPPPPPPGGRGPVAVAADRQARRVGPRQSPHLVALAGIVVLGAALRFATLDLQSYRYDEAVTVGRVLHPSLFDTLSTVPRSESTPPLYYLVAWLWSRPFGTGEVGLRSLSALAGTASIAVVYLGAVALPLPRRAGLIAAAMVAVSPVLIWFSQDARAYALVFLLTALSFLFFARARRSGAQAGPRLVGGLLGAGDRHPLLRRLRGRAGGGAAAALGRATGGAPAWRSPRSLAAAALLLPIALRQAENAHAGWIAEQPLSQRLERAGAKLVGDDNGNEHGARQPGPIPLGVPAALALAGAGAAALARRAGGSAAAPAIAAAVGAGRRRRCRCCSAPSAPTTSTGAT